MKTVLLNPGPVNVTERVRAALSRGDACHREPEVADSVQAVKARLLELFAPNDFEAILLTGSGTAALEAATIAGPGEDGTLLVLENGVYGERIRKIAQAHKISTISIKGPWERRPDLDAIREKLEKHPEIDSVAMVHHETTTGLLNPVKDVGQLVKSYGKRFVLDTVSGLAGEELDLEGWGVDFAASTANKCICGLPGVSFVMARRSALEALKAGPQRSLYFDLPLNFQKQQGGCGAFTPAIQVLWALEEALAELKEEGVEQRLARFKRVSGKLRDGIEALGMALMLDRSLLSNTISSFHLPEGRSFQELHDALKERGFVIYAGQGPLSSKIFRVANMGHVSDADYDRFLSELKDVL